MISAESISTVPSSHTSVGALTTGLMRLNWSKVLNTDSGSCSNGISSSRSAIATRRTYGESSMPIRRILGSLRVRPGAGTQRYRVATAGGAQSRRAAGSMRAASHEAVDDGPRRRRALARARAEIDPALVEAVQHAHARRRIRHALRAEQGLPIAARNGLRDDVAAQR